MGLLTEEEIKYEVEHAFDEELVLDHKPTSWELELYVYEKVLKAHLTKLREVVEGAGLTDEEILEVLRAASHNHNKLNFPITTGYRAVIKAQIQKVKEAMGED